MNGFVDLLYSTCSPGGAQSTSRLNIPFYGIHGLSAPPLLQMLSSRWGEGEVVEVIDKILINWLRLIFEHHFRDI